MKLKTQAKKLPLKPGIYKFLDAKGNILYIGRATLLRRRILNYFQKNVSAKISEMVFLAKKIEYEVTDTLLDAIILEANLIKKHWPKYNVREKDDKSFVYIVITKNKFPYPLLVRGKDLQNFPEPLKKFGPYQNYTLLKKALRIIRRIFPYSTCKEDSARPCFDRQIGLCPGVCTNEITAKEYKKNINNIILILSGKKKRLLKQLIKNNPDQATALEKINDVMLSTKDDLDSSNFNRIEGYDISHLSGKEQYGSMVVFTDGRQDKKEYRLFKIKNQIKTDDLRALGEVLERRFNHKEWAYPDLILIDGGRPQIDFIGQLFKMHSICIPFVGISKYGRDALVFPKNVSPLFKKLTQANKNVLLQVRDEAHRFAKKASKRKRKI